MNNYILTPNSSITTTRRINPSTYLYVETNNSYKHSYVFKNDTYDPLIRYVYVDDPSNQLCDCYYEPNGSTVSFSAIPYFEIKAYGIATIAEAAKIGGIIGVSNNKCIIKDEVENYNCKIKNPIPSGISYDTNRCVNYIDLEQKDDVFIKLYFRTGNHNYPHIKGYIVSNLGPSTDPQRLYLAEDISTFSVIIDGKNDESLEFSNRVNVLSEHLNYIKSKGIRFAGLYLSSGSDYAYNVKVNKKITYKNEATSSYGSGDVSTYSFNGMSAEGIVIVDSGGHDTGNTIITIDPNSHPQFTIDFTLNNNEIQSIISICRNYSDVFTGNGTLLNPYIVYIWLELSYNS